jgi:hypothetical protein
MDHLSNSAAVYRIIKRRPASAQEIFEELQKRVEGRDSGVDGAIGPRVEGQELGGDS